MKNNITPFPSPNTSNKCIQLEPEQFSGCYTLPYLATSNRLIPDTALRRTGNIPRFAQEKIPVTVLHHYIGHKEYIPTLCLHRCNKAPLSVGVALDDTSYKMLLMQHQDIAKGNGYGYKTYGGPLNGMVYQTISLDILCIYLKQARSVVYRMILLLLFYSLYNKLRLGQLLFVASFSTDSFRAVSHMESVQSHTDLVGQQAQSLPLSFN